MTTELPVSPDGGELELFAVKFRQSFVAAPQGARCAFATMLQDYDKMAAEVSEIRGPP